MVITVDSAGIISEIARFDQIEGIVDHCNNKLTGSPLAELFGADTTKPIQRALDRCFAFESPQSIEVDHYDDQSIYRLHIAPVSDGRNALVLLDPKTRASPQRDENETDRQVFESLDEVILTIAPDDSITYLCPQAARILGISLNHQPDLTFADLIHPADRTIVRSLMGDHPDAWLIDCRLAHADGSWRWFMARRLPNQSVQSASGDRLAFLEKPDSIGQGAGVDINRKAIEKSPHVTYIIDDEGTIRFVNEAFEQISGYAADDVLGAPIHLLHASDNDESVYSSLWAAMANGDVWRGEIRNRRKDGEYYLSSLTVIPVRAVETTAPRFVVIEDDITDRMALSRNRDLLERTHQLAHVGGWEIDCTTDELKWTDGTHQLHEVPANYSPTIGEAIEFYHDDDRETIRSAVNHLQTNGARFDHELRLITWGGRERWVHVTGERISENGTPKIRGAIRDISSRKQREQRLMVLNRVLRHNLRNTLNAVIGSASSIEETWSAVDEMPDTEALVSFDAVINSHIANIETSSDNLVQLAEKVRHFERVFERDLTAETVSIRHILAIVKRSFDDRFPASRIKIDGPDGEIVGEQVAVALVFEELIENSIVHHHRSTPTVVVRIQPTDHHYAVSIEDDGPGIPDFELTAITEGFETPLQHTSGLGLWAANWVMARLGGILELSSEKNDGTTVHLTFQRDS